MLDVLPTVSADGFSIQMTLKGIITEFLGYKTGDHFTFKPTASPKPQLRVRTLTSDANVWDGQTIVLGGMMDQVDEAKKASERKNLLVFVTATIVDAAGNRVHTDELSFTTNSIPKQPGER